MGGREVGQRELRNMVKNKIVPSNTSFISAADIGPYVLVHANTPCNFICKHSIMLESQAIRTMNINELSFVKTVVLQLILFFNQQKK